MNSLFSSLLILLSLVGVNNDCYDYVYSITGKKDVTEAVLLSAEINNISTSILLGYLLTENAKFINYPLAKAGEVGLFQVNINYHSYPVTVLEDMNKNAVIAGYIMRQYITADPSLHGLGRYNSATPKHNKKYRRKFLKNLKRVLKIKEQYLCE